MRDLVPERSRLVVGETPLQVVDQGLLVCHDPPHVVEMGPAIEMENKGGGSRRPSYECITASAVPGTLA